MSFFKKLAVGLAALLTSQAGKTQQTRMADYSKEQLKLQRTGMYVLAGWAGANLLSGAYFSSKTEGSAKYFHRMNLYWNSVNGVLAGTALWRLSKKKNNHETFADLYRQQQKLEKTVLLNGGLDVAYVAMGLYLNEKSKNDLAKHDQWKGFGNSVILQGGFLLLFDGLIYALLHHKGKKLDAVLEKVQLGKTENGVGVMVKW